MTKKGVDIVMDYGTILLFIIIGIYSLIKFNKDKKGFDLLIVLMAITGIFYRKTFGIYNNVGETAQIIINVIYCISLLIILVVYFINEKNKRKKQTNSL
ncbi:MAG TPA: hypothetical protein DIT16_00635 [Clostridium sp.]|nr:hypothetical protein [Clostridium sp.]HCO73344.1 hypothetical protein [Clostridium sp.]